MAQQTGQRNGSAVTKGVFDDLCLALPINQRNIELLMQWREEQAMAAELGVTQEALRTIGFLAVEYSEALVIGEVEHLEGDWNPERIVLLEFPSVDKAREWWESETYTRARLVRQRSAETKMIILEGL